MPGVDFRQFRTELSMRQVLDALGFEPTRCLGAPWRGPCPIHGSSSPRSRSFPVNVDSHRHHCQRCGSQGNQLELWAAVHQLPPSTSCRRPPPPWTFAALSTTTCLGFTADNTGIEEWHRYFCPGTTLHQVK